MKKASVVLEITAETFEEINKDIFSLTLNNSNRKIVSYYVDGVNYAERPSNVSSPLDAPKPTVPSWFSDNAQPGDAKPE